MHVLGLPPAFVLSQDQTLKFNRVCPAHILKLYFLNHHLNVQPERRNYEGQYTCVNDPCPSHQPDSKPPSQILRTQPDIATKLYPVRPNSSQYKIPQQAARISLQILIFSKSNSDLLEGRRGYLGSLFRSVNNIFVFFFAAGDEASSRRIMTGKPF